MAAGRRALACRNVPPLRSDRRGACMPSFLIPPLSPHSLLTERPQTIGEVRSYSLGPPGPDRTSDRPRLSPEKPNVMLLLTTADAHHVLVAAAAANQPARAGHSVRVLLSPIVLSSGYATLVALRRRRSLCLDPRLPLPPPRPQSARVAFRS
ncbi:hypothetical protein ANO11243_000650 [Dothideomycetidae sp. 11243]|nr:hypothetical protein ANO11243_000650 [fungal sp. No.11243]